MGLGKYVPTKAGLGARGFGSTGNLRHLLRDRCNLAANVCHSFVCVLVMLLGSGEKDR